MSFPKDIKGLIYSYVGEVLLPVEAFRRQDGPNAPILRFDLEEDRAVEMWPGPTPAYCRMNVLAGSQEPTFVFLPALYLRMRAVASWGCRLFLLVPENTGKLTITVLARVENGWYLANNDLRVDDCSENLLAV